MSSNKIVLTSSDGETFTIEEAVARQLQMVAQMMEADCVDKPITLQNVTGKVLTNVIEYCKAHVDGVADSTEAEDEEAKKKLGVWDAEFIKKLDLDMIFQLSLAANNLNVKGLLYLTCQAVADFIKDKKVDEVREIFNVENDYTPEEEEAVRKENEWAFLD